MKYNNHLNYKDRKRVLIKMRIFFALFLMVLAGVGTYFYLDYLRGSNPNTPESTTSEKSSSYVSPTINILKSPYFQFQTNKNWLEITNESSTNKYVYRSIRNNLIEQELTIYVNQIPGNIVATRVMSIGQNLSTSQIVPGEVSESCVAKVPNDHPYIYYEITMLDIKFNCDRSNSVYSVIVGSKGSDYVMKLNRPSGEIASYAFLYKNLKAENDYVDFAEILSSFQTR